VTDVVEGYLERVLDLVLIDLSLDRQIPAYESASSFLLAAPNVDDDAAAVLRVATHDGLDEGISISVDVNESWREVFRILLCVPQALDSHVPNLVLRPQKEILVVQCKIDN
jgi:hypothetical protein